MHALIHNVGSATDSTAVENELEIMIPQQDELLVNNVWTVRGGTHTLRFYKSALHP
ncbi:MAG: hypothetical protein ACTS7E_04290 [Arsenophonus sp. NC-CH8-MAG3]